MKDLEHNIYVKGSWRGLETFEVVSCKGWIAPKHTSYLMLHTYILSIRLTLPTEHLPLLRKEAIAFQGERQCFAKLEHI